MLKQHPNQIKTKVILIKKINFSVIDSEYVSSNTSWIQEKEESSSEEEEEEEEDETDEEEESEDEEMLNKLRFRRKEKGKLYL